MGHKSCSVFKVPLISLVIVDLFLCPTSLAIDTPQVPPSESIPVVLWHGMGDSCCNPLSLGSIIKTIEENIKDVYVNSLRIGDNIIEDTTNGFFMNANDQVKEACSIIAADPKLANGYNAIGFSQGGQFLRAVAQRCPNPPMRNLITMGGQHQGIYGLPHCLYPDHKWCNYLRLILNRGAYWGWVQKQFVQAEYWHDPIHEEKYREKSAFIAEINNERGSNASYAQNLNQLNKLVMVKFEKDSMVQPVETEWFGFYSPGQSINITELADSELYQKDKIGLKKMDQDKKLVFLSVPGDHLEFSSEWFIDEIINKYLKNE